MLVRWTKSASDDLTHICDYTQEHFGSAQGRRAALAIYDAAESLTALPNRGRTGRKPETRELAVSGLPFLIVYCVREDAVEIIRILHNAQKWP
jgi:toxin ParE1/3/4